jgi:GH25 family lysozyme M1 (1,4-beta-N-acetylmuramidase)
LLTVLAAAGALSVATPTAAYAAPAITPMTSPRGVDVSSHQHPGSNGINWSTVHAGGESFAFIKATEGTTYTNPYFGADWAGAAAAGMARGAYHYARPSTSPSSAVHQANHFVSVTGPMHVSGALPPVLDLEESGGLSPTQLIAWTQTWLDTVQRATGRKAVIYTYPNFWQTAMGNTGRFADYPLWIARYTATTDPQLIGGWSNWAFWQYGVESGGCVSGVPGPTDVDFSNGSITSYTWGHSGAGNAGMPSHPVLCEHEQGAAVATLQRLLHVAADGIFGSQTLVAVKTFQRAHHLTADGIVGPNTWSALIAADPKPSDPPPSDPPPRDPKPPAPKPPKHASHPTLRMGSRGSAVRVLQREVHVTADGIFGPGTRAAVIRFQHRHHLTGDGVVGPKTWAALD